MKKVLFFILFLVGSMGSFSKSYLGDTISSRSHVIPKDWILCEIGDVGQIAIPHTLELRNDTSCYSQVQYVGKELLAIRMKIEIPKSQIIFQPKGTDDLDKDALSLYARIMIRYQKGEMGDFYSWNEKFNMTSEEYQEINNGLKLHTFEEMTKLGDMKLLKWFPVEFGSINGLSYIRTSFIRQMGENPKVKVSEYSFFNSNEAIDIIMSYRLSESDMWASDFNEIIKTFCFNKKMTYEKNDI